MTCLIINNVSSYYTKTERSWRQFRVLSPDLFVRYSEIILIEMQDLPEITISRNKRSLLKV